MHAFNTSRSIQTIRDCTDTIATVPLHHWADSLQIRYMKNEGALRDQHFIITVKSDVDDAKFSVKPFAELIVINNRLRFTVRPESQYPDVANNEEVFSEIERKLAAFMKKKFSIDVNLVRNKNSDERRVANQWHLR